MIFTNIYIKCKNPPYFTKNDCSLLFLFISLDIISNDMTITKLLSALALGMSLLLACEHNNPTPDTPSGKDDPTPPAKQTE